MATEKLNQYNQYTPHAVGNLNSWKVRTLNHGAKLTEDVDNFTLVELGFDAEGQRTASQLAAVSNKGYLIAAPERRYMNEKIDEFFNGQGELSRIVYLDEGLRFETSAFELNTDGTTNGGSTISSVQAGQVAHFNPATKKFMISDSASPATDYGNATDQFVVVGNEDDMEYTLGQSMVQLEVL